MKPAETIPVVSDGQTADMETKADAIVEGAREEIKSQLSRLEFNLTSACNAKCPYCANDLRLMEDDKTLSLETILGVVDEVKPEIVNFTGGEPTIKKKLALDAIREVAARGIVTQLDTHGIFLKPEDIDAFVEAGLKRFHISYNALNPEQFAVMRGLPAKFFPQLQANLRYIAAIPDVQLLLESVVYTENFRQMPDIYRQACELGADEFQVQPLMLGGKAEVTMSLPPAILAEVLKGLFAIEDPRTPIKIWCSYVTRCSPHADGIYERPGDNWSQEFQAQRGVTGLETGCQEGYTRLHIHNNGDVVICDLADFGPIGNIYKEKIMDIYRDNVLLRHAKSTKPEACEGCGFWDNCHNVCPGSALRINNDSPPRFTDWMEEHTRHILERIQSASTEQGLEANKSLVKLGTFGLKR